MIQLGHQGDTQWYGIQSISEDAKKVKKGFIASSERSGSFHALFGDYDMYEVEGGFEINVKNDCMLNHSLQKELEGVDLNTTIKLPKKDHDGSVIKKGYYFVGIQQRFDPMQNIKKRVID